MSNIIKCENCGCEEIDIIHKYKGYYVCPKCGRDTERLHEIEHDKEVRAKVIDEFAEVLKEEYVFDSICRDDVSKYEYENKIDRIVKQMKEGV